MIVVHGFGQMMPGIRLSADRIRSRRNAGRASRSTLGRAQTRACWHSSSSRRARKADLSLESARMRSSSCARAHSKLRQHLVHGQEHYFGSDRVFRSLSGVRAGMRVVRAIEFDEGRYRTTLLFAFHGVKTPSTSSGLAPAENQGTASEGHLNGRCP